MPGVLFTNNAVGALAAGYTAAATALTLQAGQGSKFPAPAAGEWFYATLINPSNNIEIVKCTGRAGDTLTVVRGQQGTAAMALNIGDAVEARLTAGALQDIVNSAGVQDGSVTTPKLVDGAVTGPKIAAGAVGAAQIADGSVGTNELANGSVTGGKMAAGAAANNLGFVPVRQGGGVGQLDGDIIFIGWSPEAKLKITVDATDQGYLLTEMAAAPAWSAGYRGLPQNGQDANYTFQVADAGHHVIHTSASPHTYTIATEATVAIPRDNLIMLVNLGAGQVTIAPAAGVTLIFCPSGATGNRTLAQNGVATLLKVNTNTWLVFGAGVA